LRALLIPADRFEGLIDRRHHVRRSDIEHRSHASRFIFGNQPRLDQRIHFPPHGLSRQTRPVGKHHARDRAKIFGLQFPRQLFAAGTASSSIGGRNVASVMANQVGVDSLSDLNIDRAM
jgi:hypothetical protein